MAIKGRGRWFVVLLMFMDALTISLAMVLATWAKDVFSTIDEGVLGEVLREIWIPLVLLGVVSIALMRGYRSAELGVGWNEFHAIINAGVLVTGVLSTYLYLTHTPLSRVFFFAYLAIGLVLLLIERWLVRRLLQYLRSHGHFASRVLIVGTRPEVAELSRVLSESTWLGLQLAGTRVEDPAPATTEQDHSDAVAELLAQAEELDIDLILFASGAMMGPQDFRSYMWQFEGHRTQLAVVPSLVDVGADRVRTRPVLGLPIVFIEDPRSKQALSLGKRISDVVLALVFLVVLSPLMLVSALLIRSDGGPVFYRQTRIGRDGVPFQMLKFRSMRVGADAEQSALETNGHDLNDRLFKMPNDPRVTRHGRWMRRYSVDELPQLFNVLRGEMSIVGPRPALPWEVANYTSADRQRLRVRPGLTGLWQVSGRSDLTWEETIRLDLRYIDNWTPASDIAILIKTVGAVFSSRGAY